MIVAVIGLLAPIMTGNVLGHVRPGAQRGLIIEGSLLVIAAGFIAAVLSTVLNVAALRLEGRSASLSSPPYGSRLLSLPITFFSRYSTGELGTAALGVNAVQETLSGADHHGGAGPAHRLGEPDPGVLLQLSLALIATGLVAAGAAVCAVAGYREVRWQRQLYDEQRLVVGHLPAPDRHCPSSGSPPPRTARSGCGPPTSPAAAALATRAPPDPEPDHHLQRGLPADVHDRVLRHRGRPAARADLDRRVPVLLHRLQPAAGRRRCSSPASRSPRMNVVPMLERLDPILAAEPEAREQKADPGELSGQIAFSHVVVPLRRGRRRWSSTTSRSRPARRVPRHRRPDRLRQVDDAAAAARLRAAHVGGGALRRPGPRRARRRRGPPSVRRRAAERRAAARATSRTTSSAARSYTVDDAWAAARMAGDRRGDRGHAHGHAHRSCPRDAAPCPAASGSGS